MENRDKGIVLVVHSPEPDTIFNEMKELFGQERAIHISKDLYIKSYQIAESYDKAVKFIAYSKTIKNQDLTWLSHNDPGFLECYNKNYGQMLIDALNLAFNTGVLKAVYINHLCPYIKKEHIEFAFEKANDKNIVIGPSTNGRIYMMGLLREHLKVIDDFNLWRDNLSDEISEKAKKNKLSIINMEELKIIKDEDSLREWMEKKETDFFTIKNKFKIDSNISKIEDKSISDNISFQHISKEGGKHKKKHENNEKRQ